MNIDYREVDIYCGHFEVDGGALLLYEHAGAGHPFLVLPPNRWSAVRLLEQGE